MVNKSQACPSLTMNILAVLLRRFCEFTIQTETFSLTVGDFPQLVAGRLNSLKSSLKKVRK